MNTFNSNNNSINTNKNSSNQEPSSNNENKKPRFINPKDLTRDYNDAYEETPEQICEEIRNIPDDSQKNTLNPRNAFMMEELDYKDVFDPSNANYEAFFDVNYFNRKKDYLDHNDNNQINVDISQYGTNNNTRNYRFINMEHQNENTNYRNNTTYINNIENNSTNPGYTENQTMMSRGLEKNITHNKDNLNFKFEKYMQPFDIKHQKNIQNINYGTKGTIQPNEPVRFGTTNPQYQFNNQQLSNYNGNGFNNNIQFSNQNPANRETTNKQFYNIFPYNEYSSKNHQKNEFLNQNINVDHEKYIYEQQNNPVYKKNDHIKKQAQMVNDRGRKIRNYLDFMQRKRNSQKDNNGFEMVFNEDWLMEGNILRTNNSSNKNSLKRLDNREYKNQKTAIQKITKQLLQNYPRNIQNFDPNQINITKKQYNLALQIAEKEKMKKKGKNGNLKAKYTADIKKLAKAESIDKKTQNLSEINKLKIEKNTINEKDKNENELDNSKEKLRKNEGDLQKKEMKEKEETEDSKIIKEENSDSNGKTSNIESSVTESTDQQKKTEDPDNKRVKRKYSRINKIGCFKDPSNVQIYPRLPTINQYEIKQLHELHKEFHFEKIYISNCIFCNIDLENRLNESNTFYDTKNFEPNAFDMNINAHNFNHPEFTNSYQHNPQFVQDEITMQQHNFINNMVQNGNIQQNSYYRQLQDNNNYQFENIQQNSHSGQLQENNNLYSDVYQNNSQRLQENDNNQFKNIQPNSFPEQLQENNNIYSGIYQNNSQQLQENGNNQFKNIQPNSYPEQLQENNNLYSDIYQNNPQQLQENENNQFKNIQPNSYPGQLQENFNNQFKNMLNQNNSEIMNQNEENKNNIDNNKLRDQFYMGAGEIHTSLGRKSDIEILNQIGRGIREKPRISKARKGKTCSYLQTKHKRIANLKK